MDDNQFVKSLRELLAEHGLGYWTRHYYKYVGRWGVPISGFIAYHSIGEFFLKMPITKWEAARINTEKKELTEIYSITVMDESARPVLERFAADYKEKYGVEINLLSLNPRKGELSVHKEDERGATSVVDNEGAVSTIDSKVK